MEEGGAKEEEEKGNDELNEMGSTWLSFLIGLVFILIFDLGVWVPFRPPQSLWIEW